MGRRDSRTSAPTVHDTPKSAERSRDSSPPTAEEPKERFEVRGEIAHGGMGRVLRAHDHHLGRTVAIKEMLESSRHHERRFEREVEITARLQHPSILPLYDSRRWENGSPYYVMRLVSGRPLSEEIRSCERLEERLALVPNVLAAADAMAFAHDKGIIHRDIKPANILVGEHGETVLIDWGIAKILGEDDDASDDHHASDSAPPGATMPGSVLGTAGYMAPEQAIGEKVDKRADVYALGATLYHVLAGAPPYGDADSSRLVAKQLSSPPVPIRKRTPGTPNDLVAIVEKALAPKAADRYPDAQAFATDLRRFTTGRLVAAHNYSLGQRLRRFAGRHRAAVIVAFAATLALGLVLWRSMAQIRDERNQAIAASEREKDRAEDMLVLRASSLAESNPTAAAALLKRLPLESKAFAKARDVFREARIRGIAIKLPGNGRQGMDFVPSSFKLVASNDGTVWLHDFAHSPPSSRILSERDSTLTVVAPVKGGTAVAIGNQDIDQIEVIDFDTGAVNRHPTKGPVSVLAAPTDGRFVAWQNDAGMVGVTVFDTGETFELGAFKPRSRLIVSKAGEWISVHDFVGAGRLFRDFKEVSIPEGVAITDFAPDDKRLAGVSMPGRYVIEFSVRPDAIEMRKKISTAAIPVTAVFSGTGTVIVQTIEGEVSAAGKEKLHFITRASSSPYLIPNSRGFVTFRHESLEMFGKTRRTVRFPRSGEGPARGTASATHIAVTNAGGEVYAWDLRPISPRRVKIPKANQLRLVSPKRAYTIGVGGQINRIDLESGEAETIGELFGLSDLLVREDLDLAIARTFNHWQFIRLSTGQMWPKEPLVAEVVHAVDRNTILAGSMTKVGRLQMFESKPDILFETESELLGVFDVDGRIFTVQANGVLQAGHGDDIDRTQLEGPVVANTVEVGDGVVVATGVNLWTWNGRGAANKLATLTVKPKFLFHEKGAVFAVGGGALHRVESDGTITTAAVPRVQIGPVLNGKDGIGFSISENKRPAIIAMDRNHTWMLGNYTTFVNAIDRAPGKPIFGVLFASEYIDLYDLSVPDTPEGLQAAIAEVTHATVGEDLESLIWDY